MKNRNKKFTSVLAASMALSTFAPMAAVVANTPVLAADDTIQVTPTPDMNRTTTIDGVKYAAVENQNYAMIYGYSIDYDFTKNIGPVKTQSSVTLTNSVSGTSVSMPVVAIGDSAFAGLDYKGMKSINIPESVYFIGDHAFENSGIKSVTLPDGLLHIGTMAFWDSNLKGNVNVPMSVDYIGAGAFGAANGITVTLATDGYNNFNTGLVLDIAYNGGKYSIFGKDATYPKYKIVASASAAAFHRISGAASSVTGTVTSNKGFYEQAPYAEFYTVIAGTQSATPITAQNMNIQLGTSIQIVPFVDADKVVIDGVSYDFDDEGEYYWGTPAVGNHTVVLMRGDIASKTYNLKVSANRLNYWTNENFTVKNTVYGEELEVSGATAAHGTVSYEFATSANSVFTATVPTEVGTYYARAVVAESDEWAGLVGNNIVKFSITQATNEWVKEPVFEDGAVAFEAKFGTDTAKVTYTDIAGKTYEELPEEPGKYNVSVVIPATKNYTGLEVKNMVITVAPKQTGWVKNDDGKWTFYDEEGKLVTNKYFENDGFWFYVDADGVMAEGWTEVPAEACENEADAGKHYFDDGTGTSHFGWLKLADTWYFFDNATGVVVTDTKIEDPKASGMFYYLDQDGAMVTGEYVDIDGNQYYFDSYGVMKTGWLNLGDGTWNYFNEDGVQVKGQTVDGYEIDAEGVWAE